jgi:hypothetical protein
MPLLRRNIRVDLAQINMARAISLSDAGRRR